MDNNSQSTQPSIVQPPIKGSSDLLDLVDNNPQYVPPQPVIAQTNNLL